MEGFGFLADTFLATSLYALFGFGVVRLMERASATCDTALIFLLWPLWLATSGFKDIIEWIADVFTKTVHTASSEPVPSDEELAESRRKREVKKIRSALKRVDQKQAEYSAEIKRLEGLRTELRQRLKELGCCTYRDDE